MFSVAMRDGETAAAFSVPGAGDARVEVLREGRTIECAGGESEDRFAGYQVHLYKLSASRAE